MQPGVYNFRIWRGDSDRVAAILKQIDVQTQALAVVPLLDRTARLTVLLPSGTVEKTTAVGGGLTYDAASGELAWDITPQTSSSFPKGQPVPYALRLTGNDGEVDTWLIGTITAEG